MSSVAAWIETERGRFIYFLPVAMAGAIIFYFNLKSEPPLWLGGLLTAIALAALAAGWKLPPLRFAAAILLAAAFGFGRAEWRTMAMPPPLELPHEAMALSGQVTAVDNMSSGQRLTISHAQFDDAVSLQRNIRVKLRSSDKAQIIPGDHVALRAILFTPDRPAYPGGWDYGRDAYFENLGASGYALGNVTVLQQPIPGGAAIGLRRLREAIARQIMAVLPASTGSIAVTLLTGFQNQIPTTERQNFITAGLAHLLAVAGLHVGIVMGLFFISSRFLLSRFERIALQLPVKPLAAVTALLAGAGYAALTGAHLPILRSLAMASLVTFGVVAGRRALSLRGIALAAVLIMLLTPEAVIGVSFQMSFSAVLALISGYAAVRNWTTSLHGSGFKWRLAGHAFALFYTSLLAGLASMPFAAFHFQQVQPYWIFANLLAVPLTAFWVMPLGLLALALMPVGLAAAALIPMGWGIGIIIWLTTQLATWPDAMARVLPAPGSAILAFAVGLVWLCLWRSKLRLCGFAAMALGFSFYAAARPPDILVSPDAKFIAMRAGQQLLLLRQPKANNYILSQWQSVWAAAPFADFDPSTCTGGLCALPGQTKLVLALSRPAFCPQAAVVLSPKSMRGVCDNSQAVVIDRVAVWNQGAIAAWFNGGKITVKSDRGIQGSRPWVSPWPQNTNSQP